MVHSLVTIISPPTSGLSALLSLFQAASSPQPIPIARNGHSHSHSHKSSIGETGLHPSLKSRRLSSTGQTRRRMSDARDAASRPAYVQNFYRFLQRKKPGCAASLHTSDVLRIFVPSSPSRAALHMRTQLGSLASIGVPIPWNVRGSSMLRVGYLVLNALTLGSLSYHLNAGSDPLLLSTSP